MRSPEDARHLRPWTPGELSDRAFYLIAHRPFMLLACGLLFGFSELVLGTWMLIVQRQSPALKEIYIFLWLVGTWGEAAGLLAAFQTLLFPLRPLKPGPLLKTALVRLPSFVLTRMAILLTLVIFFWLIPKWSLGKYPVFGLAASIALTIASLAGGVFLLFRWSLATMVVLVENRFLAGALIRSNRLMKPAAEQGRHNPTHMTKWWLAAVIPAGVTAAACFVLVFAMGLAVNPAPFFRAGHIDITWFATREIGQGITCFLAAPLYWSGVALLYSQCRMRREAMDVMIHLQREEP